MPSDVKPAWHLLNAQTGEIVVPQLELATSFVSRLIGLQFRRDFAESQGLLIVPSASIHTAFCRVPLDAIWINCQGVVLDISVNVRPWRIAVPRRRGDTERSWAVLEVPALSSRLSPNETVRIGGGPVEQLPRRLRGWHQSMSDEPL